MTRCDDRSTYRAVGGHLEIGIRTGLSALSFWSAILLPLIYDPLLFHGPETSGESLMLLGLVGLHVVSLVGGRNYKR